MTGIKDYKSSQENISLSLDKGKLHEKMKSEWKFSNQSGEVMQAFIYLTNCRRSFLFFRLPYLESYFMVPNLVKLNVAVLKLLEKFQKDTRGEVLC